jgi:hypothetical protein
MAVLIAANFWRKTRWRGRTKEVVQKLASSKDKPFPALNHRQFWGRPGKNISINRRVQDFRRQGGLEKRVGFHGGARLGACSRTRTDK